MANYPGAFILNEVGTNKELANIYGVSERTIYRWKDKAKKETGAKAKKPTRPRTSTLIKFKGTRKELAKKYGVSERTAYRWLAKAKEKGAEIPSRQKKSTYPGAEILIEYGTNKDLAKAYNVSERTIARWKRRARLETEEPFEVLPPDEAPEHPTIPSRSDEPITEFEDLFEVEDTNELENSYSENELYNLSSLADLLTDDEGDMPLIDYASRYYQLSPNEQLQYIDAYLKFQYGEDEHQFYDESTHQMMYDPDNPEIFSSSFIYSMDIWGDDFEEWLSWQFSVRDIKL